jgi:hypothetical protein
MVRACATFVPSLDRATILLAAALRLVVSTAPHGIRIAIPLGKCKSARRQRHRQDGGNDCFTVHVGLHLVEKCHIRLAHFVVRPVPS